MENNFRKCLEVILSHEGGFVNDPRDRGGATNYGITLNTLSKWRGHRVSVEDVEALTVNEAAHIYKRNYWDAAHCGRWPEGIDLGVFDMAVNSGVHRAVQRLQKAAQVRADGAVGPVTLKAVCNTPVRTMFNDFFALRMKYYADLDQFDHFGWGWSRRLMDVHEQAVIMNYGQ